MVSDHQQMIAERFSVELANDKISITEEQLKKFQLYYALLLHWNEKMNLTAITKVEEVFNKHFYDSLTLAMVYPQIAGDYRLIDIGSGAGFPGIPLKIMFPQLKITFLDSLQKRVHYLETVCNELALENCTFIHGRAEDIAHKPEYREQFDFAVARAVARLAVLNELCLPFVKIGGVFFAMKGPDVDLEITEAGKSLKTFKSAIIKTDSLELPDDQGKRSIIQIRKTGPMPHNFPRKPGTPSKSPILSSTHAAKGRKI